MHNANKYVEHLTELTPNACFLQTMGWAIFCSECRIRHYKLTFIKENGNACGPIMGILLAFRSVWGWGPTWTTLQSRMGVPGQWVAGRADTWALHLFWKIHSDWLLPPLHTGFVPEQPLALFCVSAVSRDAATSIIKIAGRLCHGASSTLPGLLWPSDPEAISTPTGWLCNHFT